MVGLILIGGWVVVGSTYLLAFWGLWRIFYCPMSVWAVPPGLVGATLVIVPYVVGGVYCRLLGRRSERGRFFPAIVGLVPAVAEKALGLAIVWRVWASGAEGVPGQSFWDFLATGVPEIAWFTPAYWLLGLVVSPFLVQLVASPPTCRSGARPGSR